MGNKHSHRRANSFIGVNVNSGGNQKAAGNDVSDRRRHSLKEQKDSALGNETKILEQQGNKSPETTPSLSLDKLNFNTLDDRFRTDSSNSSSTNKRKSLPSNLKIGNGTPTPKIDSPATEKFWFLLNTPPQHHSNTILEHEPNVFDKPSSIENDHNLSSHSSSLTGQRSSIFDEYISGITMDVISATSPAIDSDGLSSTKKDRKPSPSAFQAISSYKNKKNSTIICNEKEAKQHQRAVSSQTVSNNVQTSIPKHLEEVPVDFSQPLMTPRHYKDSVSIALSDSVDTSISQLKHLISDDFTQTKRNNLAMQSSNELNPTEENNNQSSTTIVNNTTSRSNENSKHVPPLKLKQLNNNNNTSVSGALSAHSTHSTHSTPKNSPLVQSIVTDHHKESTSSSVGDLSTVTGPHSTITSTTNSRTTVRSLPWFISPKSPTQESEENTTSPPSASSGMKRKSRTSVSDIKGGDIDSLREQIRNFDFEKGGDIATEEPHMKFWDEIEEEEQDRKRKSMNAIYENFEHLQNIDVVIPRGSAKMSASSSSFNQKRASLTLTLSSVICGTEQAPDFVKNAKRNSSNISNIVLTDKNGETTIITPETSGALFGRGDSSNNFDAASDKNMNNRRLSLRQSLTQSFNNKRRSATAFLNSKLFKL